MNRIDDVLKAVTRALGPTPAGDALPVSVVISGRNYARYLPDCIESVQRQNPAASEVVYMDNASDDDSIAIAREMGLRTAVVSPMEQNICACRNRGALMTRQPFLVFLDADDVLPQGYLKRMHDAIRDNPRYGVVYPSIQAFGVAQGGPRSPDDPIYKPGGLYRENYICAPSMVRRVALKNSGGWPHDLLCFQDWDLWCRLHEQGWLSKRVKDVTLDVRTHSGSLTATMDRRLAQYQEVLRRRPMTVFVTFGPGRPIRGEDFFWTLENLGVPWDRMTLLFLDNSGSAETGAMLRGYLADCPARNTVYLRDDTRVTYTNISNRAMVMPERMAEMWMRASRHFDGAFVLSIEDDNVPYEPNAGWKLYEGLAPDVDAVCGPYHSRPIVDSNRLLALDWRQGKQGMVLGPVARLPGDLDRLHDGCTQIGATGVGFVLIRKDVLDGFDYQIGKDSWLGQDFGLWRHVRERGNRLMCHWGVPVKHYHGRHNYV